MGEYDCVFGWTSDGHGRLYRLRDTQRYEQLDATLESRPRRHGIEQFDENSVLCCDRIGSGEFEKNDNILQNQNFNDCHFDCR